MIKFLKRILIKVITVVSIKLNFEKTGKKDNDHLVINEHLPMDNNNCIQG